LLHALLTGVGVAVAVLAELPPAGSTDTLRYATYGRMAALGHNPYLMTPAQMLHTGDPVAKLAPGPGGKTLPCTARSRPRSSGRLPGSAAPRSSG
jgi:hypothetical protein